MRHGNRLMRGPVILGVMDVKHADRDNLRTLTAMVDTPVQRAESAIGLHGRPGTTSPTVIHPASGSRAPTRRSLSPVRPAWLSAMAAPEGSIWPAAFPASRGRARFK